MGIRPRILLTFFMGIVCFAPHAEARRPMLPADASALLARADSLLRTRQAASAYALLDSLANASTAPAAAPVRMRALFTHGAGLALQNQPAAAAPMLRTALPLALALGDSVAYSDCARWLAFTCLSANNWIEADSLYRRALPIAVASGARRAEGYIRMGQAYLLLQRGEARRAIPRYRSVAEHFRQLGDTYGELESHVGLGRCFVSTGQWDSAVACDRRTATRALVLNQPVSAGDALNNLASFELHRGDPALALEKYRAAIECFRRAGVPSAGGISSLNLAMALSNLGRATEAEGLVDSVEADAHERGLRDVESRARLSRGQMLENRQQPEAARAAYRLALSSPDSLSGPAWLSCVSSLARLLGVVDSAQTGLGLLRSVPEWKLRAADAAGRADYWNSMTGLCIRTDRYPEALTAVTRAVNEFEKTGIESGLVQSLANRGLVEARMQRRPQALASLESALRAWRRGTGSPNGPAWLSARGKVALGIFQLVHDAILGDETLGPLDHRVELGFKQLQQVKGRGTLARRGEATPSDTGIVALPTLSYVRQRVLRPGELLVDFYAGSYHSFALVISRDGCSVVELPGELTLRNRLTTFRSLMATRPGPASPGNESLRRAESSIGEWLFGPAAQVLRRARRIVISPDGPLQGVPFEAIQLPGESEPFGLLHQIEYTPSIAAWARERLRADRAVPPGAGPRVLAMGASRTAAGEPLVGVLEELRAVQRHYHDVRLGLDAPRSLMLSGGVVGRGFDIIHMAGHSEVFPDFPWRSGFLLDPGNPEREQSWIRAGEIAGMKTSVSIVVLSGCGTANGRAVAGQATEGLTQAFLTSGARAVVSSLWEVEDVATARFMKSFYDGLASGRRASAALLDARRRVATVEGTDAPYYWASFVLSGDGNTAAPLRSRNERALSREGSSERVRKRADSRPAP